MFAISAAARKHPAKSRMAALSIGSSRELARLCGTHQPVISNWLTGKHGLSVDVGRRVANILQVSVETVLYDWAPAKKKRKKRKAH
jgi:transcriptional regulator with XRE-family HTH domain